MKKLLSMILILVMVVGLVGCSKEPVGDPPIVDEEYFYVNEKNKEFETK